MARQMKATEMVKYWSIRIPSAEDQLERYCLGGFEDAMTQQVEATATVHRALDRLQPADLALRRPGAPQQGQRPYALMTASCASFVGMKLYSSDITDKEALIADWYDSLFLTTDPTHKKSDSYPLFSMRLYYP